ncbi:MAG: hypothetical protein NC299_15775 [Lachnospiraceae bacterium]|nr:hypothetical protein [Lachnospiraceae bacterium]
MLNVSTKFQEEILKPSRDVSITGTLFMGDPLEAHHIPEGAVVQNSLSITDQFSGGKFGYGSVYVKNLSVKIDYTRCTDVEGININLTNAQIRFFFYLNYDDGTSESVDLGHFLVDSARSTRKGNILTIYAASHISKFDIPSIAMENVTPYQIYKQACGMTGVYAMTSEEEIAAYPNGKLKVTLNTKQIQTARDMIMWAAELTGSYARTKIYHGDGHTWWALELAQTPIKYTKSGTSGNFDLEAFEADNGTVIPPDARITTEFTDTSVRTTTLLMNVSGEQMKAQDPNWTFTADTLVGTMELEYNPLLDGKTTAQIQTALDDLQGYTEDLRFCPFKTTFIGNPALECGDFVYLERGGSIDETKFNHYGIVTYSKWTYPNKHEIRCATDMTAERPDTSSEASAASVSGMMKAAARSTSDTSGIKPKSQIEKRLDAIGGSSSDQLVSSNGKIFGVVPSAYFPARGYMNISLADSGGVNFSAAGTDETIRCNIFPTNIDIQLSGNYGAEQFIWDSSRISMVHNKVNGAWERWTFEICPRFDTSTGQQSGGEIRFGGQSLRLENGALYVNGNKIN